MPSPKLPGPDAKQDVSVLANHLRRPRIIQGFTNDNTNSQFSLASKNPDDRENLFRYTQSGKPEQKTTMEKTMRQKARLRKEYPRSIIQLAGITIWAGAVLSYRFIRIISFPPQKTGAGHVV